MKSGVAECLTFTGPIMRAFIAVIRGVFDHGLMKDRRESWERLLPFEAGLHDTRYFRKLTIEVSRAREAWRIVLGGAA